MPQITDGWYISDSHARRAIGYLTAALPELHNTNVPWLAEKWGEALEKTMDFDEASPVNAAVVRDGLVEVKRLKAWVSDLQAGCYINCVYCGHRYGPDSEVPASMADVLKEHIEQCPDHPMSHLKTKAQELEMEKPILWAINRIMPLSKLHPLRVVLYITDEGLEVVTQHEGGATNLDLVPWSRMDEWRRARKSGGQT